MDVRLARNEDADAITEQWLDLASSQRVYGSHVLADENRSMARQSVLRHIVANELLVAVDGPDYLGFVMFTVEASDYAQDTTRGLIRNIYVAPEHRSNGVGTSLLEAAESRLTDRGVDRLVLEVMADNEPARRFYRRHGYSRHRISLEKPTENDTL